MWKTVQFVSTSTANVESLTNRSKWDAVASTTSALEADAAVPLWSDVLCHSNFARALHSMALWMPLLRTQFSNCSEAARKMVFGAPSTLKGKQARSAFRNAESFQSFVFLLMNKLSCDVASHYPPDLLLSILFLVVEAFCGEIVPPVYIVHIAAHLLADATTNEKGSLVALGGPLVDHTAFCDALFSYLEPWLNALHAAEEFEALWAALDGKLTVALEVALQLVSSECAQFQKDRRGAWAWLLPGSFTCDTWLWFPTATSSAIEEIAGVKKEQPQHTESSSSPSHIIEADYFREELKREGVSSSSSWCVVRHHVEFEVRLKEHRSDVELLASIGESKKEPVAPPHWADVFYRNISDPSPATNKSSVSEWRNALETLLSTKPEPSASPCWPSHSLPQHFEHSFDLSEVVDYVSSSVLIGHTAFREDAPLPPLPPDVGRSVRLLHRKRGIDARRMHVAIHYTDGIVSCSFEVSLMSFLRILATKDCEGAIVFGTLLAPVVRISTPPAKRDHSAASSSRRITIPTIPSVNSVVSAHPTEPSRMNNESTPKQAKHAASRESDPRSTVTHVHPASRLTFLGIGVLPPLRTDPQEEHDVTRLPRHHHPAKGVEAARRPTFFGVPLPTFSSSQLPGGDRHDHTPVLEDQDPCSIDMFVGCGDSDVAGLFRSTLAIDNGGLPLLQWARRHARRRAESLGWERSEVQRIGSGRHVSLFVEVSPNHDLLVAKQQQSPATSIKELFPHDASAYCAPFPHHNAAPQPSLISPSASLKFEMRKLYPNGHYAVPLGGLRPLPHRSHPPKLAPLPPLTAAELFRSNSTDMLDPTPAGLRGHPPIRSQSSLSMMGHPSSHEKQKMRNHLAPFGDVDLPKRSTSVPLRTVTGQYIQEGRPLSPPKKFVVLQHRALDPLQAPSVAML